MDAACKDIKGDQCRGWLKHPAQSCKIVWPNDLIVLRM